VPTSWPPAVTSTPGRIWRFPTTVNAASGARSWSAEKNCTAVRVAFLLGRFPELSETFLVRQMAGILDAGHDVDVYAAWRGDGEVPGVAHLLERTCYVDIPRASGYWEMPVRPLRGRTWLPGEETGQLNVVRVWRALPALARSLARSPRLTLEVLDRRRYGHQAESLSSLYRLAGCAGGRGYDVVHAHFGPTANDFRFAGALWKAPLVVSFHGYDVTKWPRQHGPAVYRDLFSAAAAVTAPSNDSLAKLEALGCPSDRLDLLPYGVDLRDFASSPPRRAESEPARILTIARLVEKKGVRFALEGVARLRAAGTEVRYDVVGDGPLRADLEELVARLELGDAVVFHGARDQDYIRTLLARSHIYVLPSVTAEDGDHEGAPVSLLEAMASGLPVVSTLHGGIAEVVQQDSSGVLVPERDVQGLADAIARLVRDPNLAGEMGQQGRRDVERSHDIGVVNGRLVSLYDRLITERRSL
jgi:colanic acid/amylovoran biosynthesis glycosyltransferase